MARPEPQRKKKVTTMAVVNSDAPSPPVQLNVAETAQPEPSCDRLVSVVTQLRRQWAAPTRQPRRCSARGHPAALTAASASH